MCNCNAVIYGWLLVQGVYSGEEGYFRVAMEDPSPAMPNPNGVSECSCSESRELSAPAPGSANYCQWQARDYCMGAGPCDACGWESQPSIPALFNQASSLLHPDCSHARCIWWPATQPPGVCATQTKWRPLRRPLHLPGLGPQ